MMKRTALILVFSLFATLTAAAQEKPKTETKPAEAKPEAAKTAALPTVDEIIDKYVKAIGGKEAIEKVNSREAKGAVELEGMNMSGSFQQYVKSPNKVAMTSELGGMGAWISVYDGAKGYSSDPMNGSRELSGGELDAMKRGADLHQPLKLKQTYSKMEVKGKDKVGAADVYVVEVTPAEGAPEKFYFDASSGLLVKSDAEMDSPQGKMPVEVFLEDYKAVDGVKLPFTMRRVMPVATVVVKLSEVKHNGAIDDAKFAKPQ